MNISHLFAQQDPILTAVFLLLILMSFASWYVIIFKILKLNAERKHLSVIQNQMEMNLEWLTDNNAKGNAGILIKEMQRLLPGLARHNEATRKEIIGMRLSQTLDSIRVWMDKGLTLLASVGSTAPFIGLFGTVWGIYGALGRIATAGNAGLNVVAGPMGEALVATAVGLFAAIPAVLAYNAFVRMNRVYIQELRHIAEQMTIYFSLDGKTKNGTK